MKKNMLLAAVLAVLGATPVFAQDVRYDFDKDKDFSKYKTYKWVEIKGADLPDELTQKQIMAAIDTELARKDLTRTDSDNAAFEIPRGLIHRSLGLAIVELKHGLALSHERPFGVETTQQKPLHFWADVGVHIANHGAYPFLMDGHIFLDNRGDRDPWGWGYRFLCFS